MSDTTDTIDAAEAAPAEAPAEAPAVEEGPARKALVFRPMIWDAVVASIAGSNEAVAASYTATVKRRALGYIVAEVTMEQLEDISGTLVAIINDADTASGLRRSAKSAQRSVARQLVDPIV